MHSYQNTRPTSYDLRKHQVQLIWKKCMNNYFSHIDLMKFIACIWLKYKIYEILEDYQIPFEDLKRPICSGHVMVHYLYSLGWEVPESSWNAQIAARKTIQDKEDQQQIPIMDKELLVLHCAKMHRFQWVWTAVQIYTFIPPPATKLDNNRKVCMY